MIVGDTLSGPSAAQIGMPAPLPFEMRPSSMRLASITAPRPQQQWKGVINPLGAIEPEHVGQFFFDEQNGVFYRADGPTALNWRLVTPAEMPGCMVLAFSDFLAPANHAMSRAELIEATKLPPADGTRPPHILDGRQIAEAGLRVHDYRAWQAGATRVMMARIRLELPGEVALFVGFASEPALPTKPIFAAGWDQLSCYDKDAIGVAYDDHAAGTVFGIAAGDIRGQREMPVRYEQIAVRVEVNPGGVDIFVNDDPLVKLPVFARLPIDVLAPRVSFFRYGRPA